MREMVGGCCVCSDERGWDENPLVYCDGSGCTVAVHQACYGIVCVPTGPWFCRKCEWSERPSRVRCELCPSRDGALKRTECSSWAHVVCALYIPEVRFGNVSTMEPIVLGLVPSDRYAKICYLCEKQGRESKASSGACMQCNRAGCKSSFHVTCAQSQGLLCEEAGNYMDNVKYCGYCEYHYSKINKKVIKTIPAYKPVSSAGGSPSPEKNSSTQSPSGNCPPSSGNPAPSPPAAGASTVPSNSLSTSSNPPSTAPVPGTTPPSTSSKKLKKSRPHHRSSAGGSSGCSSSGSSSDPTEKESPGEEASKKEEHLVVSEASLERPPLVGESPSHSESPKDLSMGGGAPPLTSSSASNAMSSVGTLCLVKDEETRCSPPPSSVVPAPSPMMEESLEGSQEPSTEAPPEPVLPPDPQQSPVIPPEAPLPLNNGGVIHPKRGVGRPPKKGTHLHSSSLGSSSAALNVGSSPPAPGNRRPPSPPSSPELESASSFKKKRKRAAENVPPTSSSLNGGGGGGHISSLPGKVEEPEGPEESLPGGSHMWMMGTSLNPSSSVAKEMNLVLQSEINTHAGHGGPLSRLVGAPRLLPRAYHRLSAGFKKSGSASSGAFSASLQPQTLEELLERQWEQGSQFIMETAAASHFDIASLLSSLNQLKEENAELESSVERLVLRREHLLAVRARLLALSSMAAAHHPPNNSLSPSPGPGGSNYSMSNGPPVCRPQVPGGKRPLENGGALSSATIIPVSSGPSSSGPRHSLRLPYSYGSNGALLGGLGGGARAGGGTHYHSHRSLDNKR